jgi:hypothetical protein
MQQIEQASRSLYRRSRMPVQAVRGLIHHLLLAL